jgi:hypothetical protein
MGIPERARNMRWSDGVEAKVRRILESLYPRCKNRTQVILFLIEIFDEALNDHDILLALEAAFQRKEKQLFVRTNRFSQAGEKPGPQKLGEAERFGLKEAINE